jgi:pyruvate/2-oxoglutarate/acetoin dehydrogenase E1 component
MKYGEAITNSMEKLALDKDRVFIGYNITNGSQAYGTLKTIPKEQKIEMPVAENLMIGMATGMALEGYKPVVFFERHDFLMLGADAMLNHLSTLERMSHNQFKAPVIIRATVGAKNQLYPGPQHIADYSKQLKEMVSFPVYDPSTALEIKEIYNSLQNVNHPTMMIERRELYGKEWGL